MIEMNVRIGYISIPIDYVRELKGRGQRDKARAFMEYFDDVETNDVNSFSFYAKSWNISKTQVQAWVKEFKYEIERYFSYWLIKNSQHYTSVQKSTDRRPTDNRPIDTLKSPMVSSVQKNDRPTTDRQPTEALNLNNGDNARVNFYDKHFEDLFLRARVSNKLIGNKQEAYEEYMSKHQHIRHNDMAHAYMTYVHDPINNGKVYNLANFMKNFVYMSYLNPRLRILKDGEMMEGWYDKDKESFITDSGMFQLTKQRFTELLTKGEIMILQQMKAAV